MADNYLERKMEEYRSRKAGVAPHARRKGVFMFAFPERRVLLLLSGSRLCVDLVNIFSATGSRVAVMGRPELADAASGARFYDISAITPAAAAGNLLDAWHDIDVIIADNELPSEVINSLLSARERLPYPNPYGGRFIALGDNVLPGSLGALLSDAGFSVNRVMSADSGAAARMCAFLAVPENSVITGRDIVI